MAKTTHTHRGTCQACGRVQASNNANSLVAKHGYTVNWGYFNGTCQGAGKLPAERDVTYTKQVIKFCTETAASHDDSIANLKSGAYVPQTFARYNPTKVVKTRSARGQVYNTTGGDDILPIEQATPAERARTIVLAIHEHELHASGLRSHAKRLWDHVLPRLGQPLYVAAELDAPKAKEAAPTVDVATASVTGTYKTKAARKEALDKLSRAYDRASNMIQRAYLALPHSERTEAKTNIYYSFSGLHNWHAKHAAAVLNEFPALASVVAELNALKAAREAVKAAP